MKKLTNTQIKEIYKLAEGAQTITMELKGKKIEVTCKNITSTLDMDKVIEIAENTVFAGGEYCPQYFILAKNIAWLQLCTDVPLITKEISADNSEEDTTKDTTETVTIIDYEANNAVATVLLSNLKEQYESLFYDYTFGWWEIGDVMESYVNDKLSTRRNVFNYKLDNLTTDVQESVNLIASISEELNNTFKNPKTMEYIKSLTAGVDKISKGLPPDVKAKILEFSEAAENIEATETVKENEDL